MHQFVWRSISSIVCEIVVVLAVAYFLDGRRALHEAYPWIVIIAMIIGTLVGEFLRYRRTSGRST